LRFKIIKVKVIEKDTMNIWIQGSTDQNIKGFPMRDNYLCMIEKWFIEYMSDLLYDKDKI